MNINKKIFKTAPATQIAISEIILSVDDFIYGHSIDTIYTIIWFDCPLGASRFLT